MIVVLITLSIRTDSFYLFDGLMSIYRFDGNKLGILKIFASSTFGRKNDEIINVLISFIVKRSIENFRYK